MEPINVYLIEDDFHFRHSLKQICEENWNRDSNLLRFKVIEVENFISFYKNINNIDILDSDIFIIDIDLNTNFNGIDFASKVSNKNRHSLIFFLTSLESKAIEVINNNINPIGYLIKSLDYEINQYQLKELIPKVESLLLNADSGFLFSNGTEKEYLIYSDILYITTFSGARNSLLIKTIHSTLIVDGTLKKIKNDLPSPPFTVHLKTYIINLSLVKSLSQSEGLITFNNYETLQLSPKIIRKILSLKEFFYE